ncbi:7-deoxyloganetic acid glucosyltransferase-like [Ipomoea triloba]|uniref:7-deoxyloganetic acid glucosyltransferase-like n=1 Tax=Ipomoea triloba TaxID=35885 RepID=UPI00125DFF89|nr:7-deoxyloganetic acid glucosyltransferase-like [Ipomoea triloba]
MLKLSELLCLAGVHVTFLNTEHNHRRLLGSTDAGSRFERYPGKLSFEVISDGLREDHPRSAEDFEGIVKSLQGVAEAHLREMLRAERGRKVTCVIAEGMFDYAFEIGKEVGIPVFAFETVSPCYLGGCLCIPKLLDEKEVLDENLVRELKKGCLECGRIVSWAPQEEVLAHPAIGGFWTHSGWNSTLESIVAGKPMICWAQYVDQLVTRRLVSEVWKIGVDMEDRWDRLSVEKMVKELMMGSRRQEFKKSAQKFSKLARESVNNGGSSYTSLDHLINDIRKLSSIKHFENTLS